MKQTWIIAPAALLIGFAAGFLVSTRYEYRTFYKLPVRFDRWTGKAEIIQITLNVPADPWTEFKTFDPATAKPVPDR